jgi:hypothetical protein
MMKRNSVNSGSLALRKTEDSNRKSLARESGPRTSELSGVIRKSTIKTVINLINSPSAKTRSSFKTSLLTSGGQNTTKNSVLKPVLASGIWNSNSGTVLKPYISGKWK